jgi:hypothetical protein
MSFLKILEHATPFLLQIAEATFIPKSKKFLYDNLDKAVDVAIESLYKLKKKVQETPSKVDNYAYTLGLDTLKAVSEKLMLAIGDLKSIKNWGTDK